MRILVSACLLGTNCKYNGSNNLNEKLFARLVGHTIVPVCPEVLGGLPTPRYCCEIVNGIVMNSKGNSADKAYHRGAEIALETALSLKVDLAILQSRSPSCGVNEIYDGTFSGKKIKGSGIFAMMLKQHGIRVVDIEDLDKIDF